MDTPQMQNIRIERVVPEDCEMLCGIAEETGIDAWTVENYRSEIIRDDSVVLKAVDRNEIVGFLIARVVPGQSVARDAEIYNVAVKNDRQRSGIGKLLLSELYDFLRAEAVIDIWLEVRKSNRKAILFYEKHGFKQISVRPAFYNNPVEDAVLMKFDLEGNLLTEA